MALAVVGCSGGGEGGIAIHAPGATLVAAQDGAGSWQQVPLDADDRGRFEATAGYHGIARFCPPRDLGGTLFPVAPKIVLTTEFTALEMSCNGRTPDLMISGVTTPGAEISIGNDFASADNDTYTLFVDAGVYDVVATLLGERVLIVRDLEITADRELDLPVGDGGIDLVDLTPTVIDPLGSPILLAADVTTKNGTFALFHEGPAPARVPPSSALAAGDHATIAAFGHDCLAQLPLADPVTLQLPAPLTGSIRRTGVRYEADPSVAWDQLSLNIGGSEGFFLFATMQWLEAQGDPEVMPGIDPPTFEGWTPELGGFLAPGATVTGRLSLFRGALDGDFTACSVSETFVW
ncbi:MAG: hypothetical protein ABI867_24550 [Kofleriaceae bacterium]